MTHDQDFSSDAYRRHTARRAFRDDAQSLGERFMAFLRARTTEQWLFFLAGLSIGLVLG